MRSIASFEERKDLLLPEACFVGRSNVGKSSMLNALVGAKIARTSSTPGATRRINLYEARYEKTGKKGTFLCSDFPGYGYARVSRNEHAQWQHMIENYILSNPCIRIIVWLRDVRRDFDPLDEMFLDWTLINSLPLLPVLTKADKASQGEIGKARTGLARGYNLEGVLIFSAKNGLGKSAVVSHILQRLEDREGPAQLRS